MKIMYKKNEDSGRKNKINILTALLMAAVFAAGCKKAETSMMMADNIRAADVSAGFNGRDELQKILEAAAFAVEVPEPAGMGKPGSSFELGSASLLKGRNLLIGLFVNTPESSWTQEEKQRAVDKIKIAADYIESQAAEYGTAAELLYGRNGEEDLWAEADVDFLINEEADYIDRLDEEIALWFDKKISYQELLRKYNAQGIVTCIFVNNPGISYAIVYDGTDNEQESIVLFTGDYYRKGQEETPAVYAHEILHVFGAHDLYEGGEFTDEVTDYIAAAYPNEIMYTVSGSGLNAISQTVSPITAYHLGWLEYTEEIDMFPQLNRNQINERK